jgi:hypothetical protein
MDSPLRFVHCGIKSTDSFLDGYAEKAQLILADKPKKTNQVDSFNMFALSGPWITTGTDAHLKNRLPDGGIVSKAFESHAFKRRDTRRPMRTNQSTYSSATFELSSWRLRSASRCCSCSRRFSSSWFS